VEDLAELEQAVDQIEHASKSADPLMSLRATAIFYDKMFSTAGKTIALEIVKSFNVRINALRALTISTKGRQQSAAQEMRLLYQAIASRDAEGATKASERHVHNAAEVARHVLKHESDNEDFLTERLERVRNGVVA
jgi:DNA-binding GntR family transcriptional regulator